MTTLTIFAGINGAGKTTLYNKLKDLDINLGDYICPDDILSSNNWDWRNAIHRFSSGKIAFNLINDYLQNNKSFCWETTVFGSFALSVITKAKENGYKINLHFIYVDNLNRSLERIQNRVNQGGHGIDQLAVENKFNNQTRGLATILSLVDNAYIYDNKKDLKIKGILKDSDLKFINFKNDFSKILQREYNTIISQSIYDI